MPIRMHDGWLPKGKMFGALGDPKKIGQGGQDQEFVDCVEDEN